MLKPRRPAVQKCSPDKVSDSVQVKSCAGMCNPPLMTVIESAGAHHWLFYKPRFALGTHYIHKPNRVNNRKMCMWAVLAQYLHAAQNSTVHQSFNNDRSRRILPVKMSLR